MNYTEKKEKIWTALDFINEIDQIEDYDHGSLTEEDYQNQDTAQKDIWEVLKTMSYEDIEKLANETYAIGPRVLQLLINGGTEQAYEISTLTHRFIELEEERRKKTPPLSLEEIREKIQSSNKIDTVEEDPFADLPF